MIVETKMSRITPAWFQSAGELGYSVNDPNGYQTEGLPEHFRL